VSSLAAKSVYMHCVPKILLVSFFSDTVYNTGVVVTFRVANLFIFVIINNLMSQIMHVTIMPLHQDGHLSHYVLHVLLC